MALVLTTMTEIDRHITEELKTAFPLHQIEVSQDISLRPLTLDDLDDLFGILGGDEGMTWTRRSWTRENVDFLLGLRLAHYEKYGFGVYAVLSYGKLIGMAGVQAWDHADNAVEYVAYVSRDNWNKGISTRVGRWVLERIKEKTSLNEVYAATRHENEGAKSVAQKLGFRKFGEREHFGFPSIQWRLSLR